MSANKAHDKLSVKRPQGSLVGFVTISSILFQVVLVIIFQSVTLAYSSQQPWFVPSNQSNPNIKENANTMETTSVFLISTFQYVTMAFVYSKGPPFRTSTKYNIKLVMSLLILMAINIWITVSPMEFVRNFLQVK